MWKQRSQTRGRQKQMALGKFHAAGRNIHRENVWVREYSWRAIRGSLGYIRRFRGRCRSQLGVIILSSKRVSPILEKGLDDAQRVFRRQRGHVFNGFHRFRRFLQLPPRFDPRVFIFFSHLAHVRAPFGRCIHTATPHWGRHV